MQRSQSRPPGTFSRSTTIIVIVIAAITFLAGRSAATHDLDLRYLTPQPATADPPEFSQLLTLADNVFFGRVLTVLGQREDQTVPYTQFRVAVVESFKGNLSGTAVVEQEGGYRRAANELVQVSGDCLIQPERMYLLATRPVGTNNLILIPILGDVAVDSQDRADQIRNQLRPTPLPPAGGGRAMIR